jgi:hypothetical protein
MMAILHTERGKRIGARGYLNLTGWSRLRCHITAPQRSNIHNNTTLNSCKTLTY